MNQEITRKIEERIFEYEQHLKNLNSTKDDYKELINTLSELPNTLQPKIMVPLGKLAFFEGNLKSTNEILVLLGDNYFAKRSTKQTIDLIQRRDKDIDSNIKDLNEQILALKQRVTLSTDLSNAINEKDFSNIVEIKEEYDSDEEREKERKKQDQLNEKQKQFEKQQNNVQSSKQKKQPNKEELKKKEESDNDFDKMLKRLELLEKKERSLGEDYDEEEFNRKFSKGLNFDDDEDGGDDNEDEYEYFGGNDGNNNDIEEYEDDEDDEDVNGSSRRNSGIKNNKDVEGDYIEGEYYDENDGYEYYDENGNLVDINDPNVEYIEEEEGEEEGSNIVEKEDIEFDENDLEEMRDFHFSKTGHDLTEKEVKELKDYYIEKKKKRISFNIDTPQPPTPPLESNDQFIPKSILKTSSSSNNNNKEKNQNNNNKKIYTFDPNDENDPRRYIKNLEKQELFKNDPTITKPNPPKDTAFSGDIIEKDTELFPIENPIISPMLPQKQQQQEPKQSRFKSSRQNK